MTDRISKAEALKALKRMLSMDLNTQTVGYNQLVAYITQSAEDARIAEAVRGAKVVAWLCEANDGSNIDATAREFVRDDYARFGRNITPLIPASVLGEWEKADV